LYGDADVEGLKYMCRPCWWLKGQPYKQPDYKVWVPNAADVDLFFPEGSGFAALKKKMKNPATFFSQQLNSPLEAAGLSFTEEMMTSCFIDHKALPKRGLTFEAWDLATSVQNYRDYTVGIVGLLDEKGEWWIIDIKRGRFDFTERCSQVVNAIREYRPKRVAIEDVHAAQDSMTPTLDRQAKIFNVPLNIDWINLGQGTADQKFARMSTLHPWLRERRIHFLNTLPYIDDLVKEFCNIGNKNAQNDIPDAVAHLVQQYSRHSVEMKAVTSEDDERAWREMEELEFRQMIFQQGRYSEPEIVTPEIIEEIPDVDPMTGLPGNPLRY
jgi:predicted phage terminase large subunit-like protein